MNGASKVPSTMGRSDVTTGILVRAAQLAAGFVVLAALLFGGAGRLDWAWAWVYLGIFAVTVGINGTLMMRHSRETLAERGRPKDMRGWDQLVSALLALAQYVLLPLVAGLDVRFGWTRDPGLAWHLAGAVAAAAGLALSSWAMLANTFFSTVVRIQSERGHTVCRSGPYQLVRHPGYLGMDVLCVGTALLLGSWWALLPALLAVAALTVRTALEDRTLQAELPGYRDYAAHVRYRLLPGVW